MERALYLYVLDNMPGAVHSHRLPRQWNSGRRSLWTVDIFIPEHKLVIEFDGEHWHGPSHPGGSEEYEAALVRDKAKADDLREQGYRVIRVRQGRLPLLHPDDLSVPRTARIAEVGRRLLQHTRALGITSSQTSESLGSSPRGSQVVRIYDDLVHPFRHVPGS